MFDHNIVDLGQIGFDLDSLERIALGMSNPTHATTTIANVLKEFDQFHPKDGHIAHVEDPISNCGDEFDD